MTIKRQALGKGLSALLENANTDITSKYEGEKVSVVGATSTISLNQIEANPFQPRSTFEKTALMELAQSIREHGIIQPVTVRKLGYDKYQLISGERRFKASGLAGLTHIPVFIRIANDQSMLEMALVENIQRENLDAIEIALSYKRLIEECQLTQEQLSEKVSKERSTIANYLRLLKLPAQIQIGIRNKAITMGHARALINIENPERQLAIYNEIVENELSVRQTEELARNKNQHMILTGVIKKTIYSLPPEYKKIRDDLSSLLNTSVELKHQNNGKGKLVINFKSNEELKRILKTFGE